MFRFTLVAFIVLALSLCSANESEAVSLTLTGAIRDFCAPDISGSCSQLSDFEGATTGVVKGMVSKQLNSAGVPDYVGSSIGGTNVVNFAKWYSNSPGFNLGKSFTLDLPETSPGSGLFEYKNAAFFPIDNQLFGNQNRTHNFHFTLQLSGKTSFIASDTFTFTGDDDLWVYIDKKLVIDLGGVHEPANITITGADLIKSGLSENTPYELNVFFAERHTNESNFNITTSFRPVPELASLELFSVGLILLGLLRGKKNKYNLLFCFRIQDR